MPTLEENPEDLIALSLVEGAGRKTLHAARRMAMRQRRALSSFFSVPLADLLPLAAPGESGAAEALSRCGAQEQFRAAWMMSAARDSAIRVVLSGAPDYPKYLVHPLGNQAPPLLFLLGNEALLESPGAGIVGTRHPTGEGTDIAIAAARLFAEEGIPVVSGGARGIDQAAHHAALKADGSTVAIVPEGLQSYEPPDFIRAGMDRGQVLLVSEYLPTDGWHTHRAMTRNRTIAACSSLVCVIEPKEKGGSMFTAEQALEQGRTVFYWGGACRDGALRDRNGAYRLTDARGKLQKAALLHAAQRKADAPEQIGLFD
jgi:DNA protecting protein DprA